MAISKIKSNSIADDAITSDKVADGVISAADVADGTLTNAKLADGTIESAKLASGVTDVSNDTTPQLGGNLDVNSNSIVSSSNADISISPNGIGRVILGAAAIQQTAEKVTTSATAATGTINYDVVTQSVLNYTSDASANWTLNIRGDASNTLNSIMDIGESLTIAHIVAQGGTAYYNSAVQIDGSSVTPKWQGGSAPTDGNTNSLDIYTYTAIKTADATFTILASQTQFA
jgi:hypothetical protein